MRVRPLFADIVWSLAPARARRQRGAQRALRRRTTNHAPAVAAMTAPAAAIAPTVPEDPSPLVTASGGAACPPTLATTVGTAVAVGVLEAVGVGVGLNAYVTVPGVP